MARIDFRIDDGALDELVKSDGVGQIVGQVAAEVAQTASALVPVRTGAARASYKATGAEAGEHGMVANVYTDDPAGHIIEFGGAYSPALAPLRRAVASDPSLRFTETPKGETT